MMTPAARTFSMWRLVAALSVIGTLTMATSMGPYAFWASAFLWAVPPLVAMRCLPLPLGLAIVVVTGTVGRFVAQADLETSALATLFLVPAFVVDRFVFRAFPRVGICAWPLLVTATVLGVAAFEGVPPAEMASIAPVPDIDGAQMAAAGHFGLAVALTAVVAQGWAGMATILNFHVPDRHAPEVRELGVRIAALVSFALLAAFGVAALLY